MFTAIDCFCGAGGLSLGLSKAGFYVILSFDSDSVSNATLHKNKKYFNHSVLNEKIENISGKKIFKITGLKKGDLDLLAGGPPCQGFSLQRTIGPDNDKRNILIFEYLRLINEVRPKFFLFENVLGLKSFRGKGYLSEFVKKAEEAGYSIHTKVLNAQDYGVPQRRKRLFLVGQDDAKVKTKFNWPEVNKESMTVRMAFHGLPSIHKSTNPMHVADRLSKINLQRISYLKEGESFVNLPKKMRANCHKKGADKIGHRNVYGRMRYDAPAPTITARFDSFTRGKFGHPVENRTISLLEGALLQSFPPDFSFSGTKCQIARQIGNAVPPLLAFAIGRSLQEALKHEKST